MNDIGRCLSALDVENGQKQPEALPGRAANGVISALALDEAARPTSPDCAKRAFVSLVLPLFPRLKRRALALTGHTSEASDLLQSTLERAWKHFAVLSRYDNVSSWMFLVMRRLFVDEYRKNHVRLAGALDELIELPAPANEQEPLWTQFTVSDVMQVLDLLPLSLREPFALHEFEGLAYREIAVRLGIPIATVGTRILRARHRMRALLVAHKVAALGAGAGATVEPSRARARSVRVRRGGRANADAGLA